MREMCAYCCGFLFLMSCSRAEVWQQNQTMCSPRVHNPLCDGWPDRKLPKMATWARWGDQGVTALLLALMPPMGSTATWIPVWNIPITFQNILITRLRQWNEHISTGNYTFSKYHIVIIRVSWVLINATHCPSLTTRTIAVGVRKHSKDDLRAFPSLQESAPPWPGRRAEDKDFLRPRNKVRCCPFSSGTWGAPILESLYVAASKNSEVKTASA